MTTLERAVEALAGVLAVAGRPSYIITPRSGIRPEDLLHGGQHVLVSASVDEVRGVPSGFSREALEAATFAIADYVTKEVGL